MKIDVKDIKNNKIKELELSADLFEQPYNQDLISHYVYVFRANQRQGTSSTKTRAEVSGGGRKPWKQKGTGRARAGSTRGPIWVHGGIAHGPKPKDWSLSFPEKMKKLVFKVALSNLFKFGKITVFDKIDIEKPSTKQMMEIFKTNKLYGKTLLILDSMDQNIIKSADNIRDLRTVQANNVCAYDIVSAGKVVFLENSLRMIEERFNK